MRITQIAPNVSDASRRYIQSQKRSLAREAGRIAELCEPICAEPCAEQRLLDEEMAEQLNRALMKLPMAHREILQWRFLDSRSCEEIATVLQRSEAAVRMMVNRALKKLASHLPQAEAISVSFGAVFMDRAGRQNDGLVPRDPSTLRADESVVRNLQQWIDHPSWDYGDDPELCEEDVEVCLQLFRPMDAASQPQVAASVAQHPGMESSDPDDGDEHTHVCSATIVNY